MSSVEGIKLLTYSGANPVSTAVTQLPTTMLFILANGLKPKRSELGGGCKWWKLMISGGDAGQEVTGLEHDTLLWLSGTTGAEQGCSVRAGVGHICLTAAWIWGVEWTGLSCKVFRRSPLVPGSKTTRQAPEGSMSCYSVSEAARTQPAEEGACCGCCAWPFTASTSPTCGLTANL